MKSRKENQAITRNVFFLHKRNTNLMRISLVMFFLGVPLLILLIATVTLGIAMGVYGKQVFLPHMICAGLSMTLALGHAVVGIVWFYPF